MLDLQTKVDVVCTKNDKVVRKEMTLSQWKTKKPKKGWICRAYQIGFNKTKY